MEALRNSAKLSSRAWERPWQSTREASRWIISRTITTFEQEVTDPRSHSSLLRAENAIYRRSRALLTIEGHAFPVRLNEVTRVCFERSAALHPRELAAAMRGIQTNPPDPAAIATLSAIPVYGVSGIFHDVDDVRAHGRDERVLVHSFLEGQEFLYRLVKRLSSG
jgi:hypothetical protein